LRHFLTFQSLILAVWWFLTCHSLAGAEQTADLSVGLTPLRRASVQLAYGIEQQFSLSGRTIQISTNNFWKRGARINLPFSDVLAEALATAFSQAGAIVTVQELGQRPLRLLGSYGPEGDQWLITGRIRQMGETASQDLAITRVRIPIKEIDTRWRQPDFVRVARTLIRMLEENYVGLEPINVQLSPLAPGVRNQTSIRLGYEFQKYLTQAAAASPLFISQRIGISGSSYPLNGTYTLMKDHVRFHLEVLDRLRIPLTSAFYEVPVDIIPPEFWRPYAGSSTKICVVYQPDAKANAPEASTAVQALLQELSAILSAYGLDARLCPSGRHFTPRLEASLRLRRRQTGDGYGLLLADLQLKSIHQTGRIQGTLTEKGKNIFHDDPEAASLALVSQIIDRPGFAEKLAGIALRP
jgi:hypothetical protein